MVKLRFTNMVVSSSVKRENRHVVVRFGFHIRRWTHILVNFDQFFRRMVEMVNGINV